MARSKVKLTYIHDIHARKSSFKNRKAGLMKKLKELSTLCGIEACAVVFCPFTSQPDTWPSAEEATRVAVKYQNLPQMKQTSKLVDQESYLKQRLQCGVRRLQKLRQKNRDMLISQIMFEAAAGKGFDNLTLDVFDDLKCMIDRCLNQINDTVQALTANSPLSVPFDPSNGEDAVPPLDLEDYFS